jgi:hypothetical protein
MLSQKVLDFCDFLLFQKYSGDHFFTDVYELFISANPNTILEYFDGTRKIWKLNKSNYEGPTTFLQAEGSSILSIYKENLQPINEIVHKLQDLDVMTLKMILNAVINDSFEGVVLRSSIITFDKKLIKRTQREMVLQCVNYCLEKIEVPKYRMLEDKKFKFLNKKEEIYKKFTTAIEKFELVNKEKQNLKISVIPTYNNEESKRLRQEELKEIHNKKVLLKENINLIVVKKDTLNQLVNKVVDKKNKEIIKENETPIFTSKTPAGPQYNEYSKHLTDSRNEIMLMKKQKLFDEGRFDLLKEIRTFIDKKTFNRDQVLQKHCEELIDHAYIIKMGREVPMNTVSIFPEQKELLIKQNISSKNNEKRYADIFEEYKRVVKQRYFPNKHKNRWYKNFVTVDKEVNVNFTGTFRFKNVNKGEERIKRSRVLHSILNKRSTKGRRGNINTEKLNEDLDTLISEFKNKDQLIRNLGSISIANRMNVTQRRAYVNLNNVKLSIGCFLEENYFPLLPKKIKFIDKRTEHRKYEIVEVHRDRDFPEYEVKDDIVRKFG